MRNIINKFGSLSAASFIALVMSTSAPDAALASGETTVTTVEYEVVEEGERDFVPQIVSEPKIVLEQFGPFYVTSETTVELRGTIYANSPFHFRTLLSAFPSIRTLVMVECPGSEDDDANLALARMIRRAGMNTVIPAGGSVRSGGVELFLAGHNRMAAQAAQIGVHSWRDEFGREATDYPPNHPVHGEYIRYYIEMGMSPDRARAFYTFTNRAAPSTGVHYMTQREIVFFGLTTAS